jgi:large subunit ribosomal protein L30
MLKITLTKSTISETPRNRATVHALGLRKTNRSVLQEDNPVIQGMIHHVKHLVKVEDAGDVAKTRKRLGKKAASAAPAAAKKAPAAATEAAPAAAPQPAAAKKTAAPAKKTTTKKKDS